MSKEKKVRFYSLLPMSRQSLATSYKAGLHHLELFLWTANIVNNKCSLLSPPELFYLSQGHVAWAIPRVSCPGCVTSQGPGTIDGGWNIGDPVLVCCQPCSAAPKLRGVMGTCLGPTVTPVLGGLPGEQEIQLSHLTLTPTLTQHQGKQRSHCGAQEGEMEGKQPRRGWGRTWGSPGSSLGSAQQQKLFKLSTIID